MRDENQKVVPKHVALIMDGNRRWARQRGLPAVAGHRKVVEERIEELIEAAAEWGIEYITFWAFSTENWNRDGEEVSGIMDLFRWALKRKAKTLIQKGARLRMIGDLERFPEDIQTDFREMSLASNDNNKITATFALNYGGRDEIVRAVRRLLQDVQKGLVKAETITTEKFETYLDTKLLPDPDLIIRTSGEERLSGFMPWQSVYSEFYFTKTLMPDFGKSAFEEAIESYSKRERRFGAR